MKHVFVIGAGRSGTTLLMNLLDNHRQMVAPPEHDFLMPFLWRYGGESSLSLLQKNVIIDNLWLRKQEFKEVWGLDVSVVIESGLMDRECSFADFYSGIMSCYGVGKEVEVLFDKNPYYTAQVTKIMEVFPDAKFVGVVRDYRGRYESIKRNENKVFRNNIVRSLKWLDFTFELIEKSEEFPGKFMMLKYEDLLVDPIFQLSRICEFVGLNFQSGMEVNISNRMRFKEVGVTQSFVNKMHVRSNASIDRKRGDIWKGALSKEEVDVLDVFCGDLGESIGYEVVSEFDEKHVQEIKKKYRWEIRKGRFLFGLKEWSYRVPLWIQKFAVNFYRFTLRFR